MRSDGVIDNDVMSFGTAPHVMSLTGAPRRDSSHQLTNKVDAASVFVSRPSARVLIVACAVFAAARVALGGWVLADLIVVATIGLIGPVEWAIHKWLLHASEDAWTTRVLGTSVGHRQHHLRPNELDWLLLRGRDAAVFVVAFGVFTAAWAVPVLWATGSPILGPFVMAWLGAALGLIQYEWVHLLVHTRYRPHTRYYRRLARNHRLHHYRNERFWYGVTANLGDRVLGTYPRHTSDVPLSETARSLGGT